MPKIFIPFDDVKETPLYKTISDQPVRSMGKPGINENELKYFTNISNNFKIGPYMLENVRYLVASEETPLAGQYSILGYDVLKHFVVTLDMVNKNLYLSAPG